MSPNKALHRIPIPLCSIATVSPPVGSQLVMQGRSKQLLEEINSENSDNKGC